MLGLLRNPLYRTWLLLILASAATFELRADGFVGLAAGAATLVIAYLKQRLVILDFMELRHAPLVWRLALEGWLLVVSLIILSVYWLGTTAN